MNTETEPMPETHVLALYRTFAAFPDFGGHLGLEAADSVSGFAFQTEPGWHRRGGYINGTEIRQGNCSVVWYQSEIGTDDRKSAHRLAEKLADYLHRVGEIPSSDGVIFRLQRSTVPVRRRLYGDGAVWDLRFSYRCIVPAAEKPQEIQ